MFLTIGNVLSASNLAEVRDEIGKLSWHDGKSTAGRRARSVKRNEQADLSVPAGQSLLERVIKALREQSVFQAAARPRKYSKFLLSRSRKDGGYGRHVDNAIMGRSATRLRSDLSFTLFLNDPSEYEGGALELDFPAGTQSIKLDAGDMVLYPSTLIHEVKPVTSGERIVLVGWIESEVRDPSKREILFDLDRVRLALSDGKAEAEAKLILDKVYSNLLRLWDGS